jgi:hypothetical protein
MPANGSFCFLVLRLRRQAVVLFLVLVLLLSRLIGVVILVLESSVLCFLLLSAVVQ